MASAMGKISFELLKGRENFDSWAIGVKAYLTIKDLWKWTTTEPKVTSNVVDTEESAKDAKAISELILLIDPSLYSFISKATSTKKAWDSLVEAFQTDGTCQKIFTLQKFVSSKADNYATMHEYVNEMLKLYAKVTNAGFNIDDKTAGSLLLAGLSAEYRPMILGIENSGTAITVDYVKNLLLQNVLFETSNEQVLAVKKKGKDKKYKKKVKCYNCGGDHYKNKCPQLKQNNKNESEKVLLCLRSECNTEKQYECSQVKQIDELSEVFFGARAFWAKDEDTWYIDSGASSHMTNNESSVIDVVKCNKDSVFAADGKKMNIIGKGDIRKKLADESELIIKNVEIIPSICANLLSVSQIVMKSENKVIFDRYGCKITNGNGNLIASGRLENGMFKLNLSSNRAYATKKSADIGLWHKRLGHIGFDNMRFLNINIPNGQI